WTVMVGLLTLVTNRVGSVISTSFRVSFGDMRTFSGPMSPLSSGTLPGHSATTSGLSARATGQATHHQAIKEMAATIRFMVVPLFREPVEHVQSRRGEEYGVMVAVGLANDDKTGWAL